MSWLINARFHFHFIFVVVFRAVHHQAAATDVSSSWALFSGGGAQSHSSSRLSTTAVVASAETECLLCLVALWTRASTSSRSSGIVSAKLALGHYRRRRSRSRILDWKNLRVRQLRLLVWGLLFGIYSWISFAVVCLRSVVFVPFKIKYF